MLISEYIDNLDILKYDTPTCYDCIEVSVW